MRPPFFSLSSQVMPSQSRRTGSTWEAARAVAEGKEEASVLLLLLPQRAGVASGSRRLRRRRRRRKERVAAAAGGTRIVLLWICGVGGDGGSVCLLLCVCPVVLEDQFH